MIADHLIDSQSFQLTVVTCQNSLLKQTHQRDALDRGGGTSNARLLIIRLFIGGTVVCPENAALKVVIELADVLVQVQQDQTLSNAS